MEREASGEGQADLAGRLSDELWCIVFSFLPAVDVLHLGSTARRFYAISNEEAIWRELCRALWEGKQRLRFELLTLQKWCSLPDAWISRSPLPQPVKGDFEVASSSDMDLRVEEAKEAYLASEEDLAQAIHRLRRDRHRPRGRLGEDADDEDEGTLQVNMRDLLLLQQLSQNVGVKRQEYVLLSDRRRFLQHPGGQAVYVRAFAPLSRLRRELRAENQDPSLADSRVLSWRDSYRASVQDAQRICPQPAEVEGDWMICFGGSYEVARFVEGGHTFIDNRGFAEQPGAVVVAGDRLYIGGVPHTVLRTADWGWKLVGDNGFVDLFSLDPRLPPPRPLTDLLTPLRANYPEPRTMAEWLREEEQEEARELQGRRGQAAHFEAPLEQSDEDSMLLDD